MKTPTIALAALLTFAPACGQDVVNSQTADSQVTGADTDGVAEQVSDNEQPNIFANVPETKSTESTLYGMPIPPGPHPEDRIVRKIWCTTSITLEALSYTLDYQAAYNSRGDLTIWATVTPPAAPGEQPVSSLRQWVASELATADGVYPEKMKPWGRLIDVVKDGIWGLGYDPHKWVFTVTYYDRQLHPIKHQEFPFTDKKCFDWMVQ